MFRWFTLNLHPKSRRQPALVVAVVVLVACSTSVARAEVVAAPSASSERWSAIVVGGGGGLKGTDGYFGYDGAVLLARDPWAFGVTASYAEEWRYQFSHVYMVNAAGGVRLPLGDYAAFTALAELGVRQTSTHTAPYDPQPTWTAILPYAGLRADLAVHTAGAVKVELGLTGTFGTDVGSVSRASPAPPCTSPSCMTSTIGGYGYGAYLHLGFVFVDFIAL